MQRAVTCFGQASLSLRDEEPCRGAHAPLPGKQQRVRLGGWVVLVSRRDTLGNGSPDTWIGLQAAANRLLLTQSSLVSTRLLEIDQGSTVPAGLLTSLSVVA